MSVSLPYALKPVPSAPTHCGCGAELEPLRRYAGLCARCVAARPRPRRRMRPAARLRVLEHFKRRGEKCVRIECGCGARRIMTLRAYKVQRPESCQKCRLREVDRRGFEAEYAR